MNDAIKELTKDYTTLQLRQLADWAGMESRERDPVRIAEQKAAQAIWKQREAEGLVKEQNVKKIVKVLRATLKPGMVLKMKGCKDGSGIREFINWDENDNLVCWQLHRQRRLINSMAPQLGFTYTTTKTNQVTQHMADKVTRIFIDGKDIPIKNFVK